MNKKPIWTKPGVVMPVMGVFVGILWAVIANLKSSDNPPSWTQHAIPVVGVVSGLAFFAVAYVLTVRKTVMTPPNHAQQRL